MIGNPLTLEQTLAGLETSLKGMQFTDPRRGAIVIRIRRIEDEIALRQASQEHSAG